MLHQQKSLFTSDASQLATKREDQWFDRKSARISPERLANLLVGFANADGGTIVIGVEEDGRIIGIKNDPEKQNELRLTSVNFTQPPVPVTIDLLDCTNAEGEPDQVLIIEVPPSGKVHRNHRHEAFVRYGDQNRRLTEDAAFELIYSKGERFYDESSVPGAKLDDLDRELLARFARAVGTGDDVPRALRVRGLANENNDGTLCVGAVLLFGQLPDMYFPGAYVRILRYEGTAPLPGTRLNLSFDRRISGPLTVQIATAETIMTALLGEKTTLDPDTGRFVTSTDVPRFAWLEAIVNAVTHRSYSMQGDHIRVSVFDDRIEIFSPGQLPGPVRIDNIRHTRFARNPRIARALAELGVVREVNEGVPRMIEEMTGAGLPNPDFQASEAGFKVILRRYGESERERVARIVNAVPAWMIKPIGVLLSQHRITTAEAAKLGGVTVPAVRRHLQRLEDMGEIVRVARSQRDPDTYWSLRAPIGGDWSEDALRREKSR